MFDVPRDVPIGDISTTKPGQEVEISEADKAEFDLWLRKLWSVKDQRIGTFLETGSFSKARSTKIPVQLRRRKEILDAFCFFLPAAIAYAFMQAVNGH